MRVQRRLFPLLCTVLLLAALLTPAAAARRFSMSYVYFGSPSSYVERVDGTQGSLDEISPNYFNLNSDGTLNFTGGSGVTAFVEQMHRRGVRVVPFLSNHWDRELGRKALSNRKKLAEQIARAVVQYGLDGVNVDIENVTHQDRNAYSEFVEFLRQKLPEDKIVAVSVAANPYGYTQGWHGSYDYRRLGAAADYLMLMTYDEHYQGGSSGPVASRSFQEQSIQYALKYVPADKLVLGLPFFGRIWSDSGSLMQGHGISESQIQALIANYRGQVAQDAASGSAYARITVAAADPKPVINGVALTVGTYTIWYESEISKKNQLSLVEEYGLLGAGSWSLGQEDTRVWDYYSMWLNGWTFEDSQGHWAVPYIIDAADQGKMTGLSATAFGPDRTLTRGEAAVVLCRLAKLSPRGSGSAFSDLRGHWSAGYVQAAYEAGLAAGVGGGRYAPDEPVTRQEIAVMLDRVRPGLGGTALKNPFPDLSPGGNAWSYEAVLRLYAAGVVTGMPDGTFRPGAPVSRAELAVMLSKLPEGGRGAGIS